MYSSRYSSTVLVQKTALVVSLVDGAVLVSLAKILREVQAIAKDAARIGSGEACRERRESRTV